MLFAGEQLMISDPNVSGGLLKPLLKVRYKWNVLYFTMNWWFPVQISKLRPTQNSRHFAGDISKFISLNENLQIALNFVIMVLITWKRKTIYNDSIIGNNLSSEIKMADN